MKVKNGALGSIIQRYGVPDGWLPVTVGDLARIVGGATPSRTELTYWFGGNIPWATPTDITKQKSKYIFDTDEHITELGLRSCAARLLPVDTILYTSRATIGAKSISRVPIATNQGFASFMPYNHVDMEFLYYYLDLLTPVFIRLAAGTTFLEINKRDMRNVQCALPELLSEQQAIARALSSIDNTFMSPGLTTEKARAQQPEFVTAYQRLKQSLARELLTGRTRVRLDEDDSIHRILDA